MTPDKEMTHRLLDAVIQLDDFCYLVGMSEEYHCQYPEMVAQLQNVKRSLTEGIEQGLTPSGRIDAAQLAGAFPQALATWQTRISEAVDRVLPATQHLLLPFPGKGVVEHSVDSAFQRLVQQQANADPSWVSKSIDNTPSVFNKMAIQQAFCDGLVESSLSRRVLLHCSGLYDALGAYRELGGPHIPEELASLHSEIGFHAERVLIATEGTAKGQVTRLGYDSASQHPGAELLNLSSDEPLSTSHLLEMAAQKVSIPETPEITHRLCRLAEQLVALPAPTQSVQLIADALAFRIAQMASCLPQSPTATPGNTQAGGHRPPISTTLTAGA